MKNRQADTYNTLYPILRQRMSSRDMTFQLNTFYDGSAFIMVTVFRKNGVITLSMGVVPEFDENDNIVMWRINEEDKITRVKSLRDISIRLSAIIQDTRIILAKI